MTTNHCKKKKKEKLGKNRERGLQGTLGGEKFSLICKAISNGQEY